MKKNLLIQFIKFFSVPFLLFTLTLIYLFPLLQDLILLPIDLLVSNYTPWYQPGTILLKNPYMQDSIIQLFPWRHLVFESLTKGVIPFWNPYQHLGLPFMANLKPMVFYPLNIFFIFGEIKAWNYLLFSQIFLAMLFAYYLARDFKLKILPSILTAFAFGLNSYMIGLLEFGSDAHTIIWWPLLILFAKRFMEKQNGKYLLFLGITFAFSIFAGQLQYLAYFMFLFLGFILYYGRSIKAKLSVYIFLFSSTVLGFGLSAIQLIPSIELFIHSHRGLLSATQNHEVFSRGLVLPYQHFRLLSPDFFGNPVTKDATSGYIETSGYFGIISFFFSLFAMIFARKNKFVKLFSVVFILSLLFSLKGVGELLYFLKIPLITSGQGDRIFTLVLFSGAFLSGFGLSEFMEMKNIKKKYLSVLIFLFLSIFIGISYIFLINQSSISLNLFLQHVKFSYIILGIFSLGSLFFLFSLSLKKHERIFKILFLLFILVLTFFDLFRLGYRFLTFSNKKFLYPEMNVTKFIKNASEKNLSRIFGLAEPELGTYLNIYTVETYNPLYLLRTSRILQSLQNKSADELSIDNKYFLTSSRKDLKNSLDFLGVEYIVATIAENPSTKYFNTNKFEKDLQKIYSDDRYSVYKNLNAHPRFALYYQAIVVKNDKDILSKIGKENIDLDKSIILEEDMPFSLQKGSGSAQLLSQTVNTQKFEATTTKPALFYISDTFYPGWKAKVNNQPTKIFRANYNFRAILIAKGKSIIEFTYMPTSFILGGFVSIISILILIFLSYNANVINRNHAIKRTLQE